MAFFSVGHSTRSQDDFGKLIFNQRINLLVDVRSFPGSRRYPNFNKETMPDWLQRYGVDYLHLPALGGRRRNLASGLNDGWRNISFRSYADYSLTPTFKDGIRELMDVAADLNVAYMCSEAVPWRCHRTMISDALVLAGHTVDHIMTETSLTPHRLGAWGAKPVITDTGLIYPGAPSSSRNLSLF